MTPPSDLKKWVHTPIHLDGQKPLPTLEILKDSSVITESNICTQTFADMPTLSDSRVSTLFFFSYNTWLRCESSLIETASALLLMAVKRTFYLPAAFFAQTFSFFSAVLFERTVDNLDEGRICSFRAERNPTLVQLQSQVWSDAQRFK